jgi:hypothetical protein
MTNASAGRPNDRSTGWKARDRRRCPSPRDSVTGGVCGWVGVAVVTVRCWYIGSAARLIPYVETKDGRTDGWSNHYGSRRNQSRRIVSSPTPTPTPSPPSRMRAALVVVQRFDGALSRVRSSTSCGTTRVGKWQSRLEARTLPKMNFLLYFPRPLSANVS